MAYSTESNIHSRPHFSEKIENFYRTTENVYTTKGGSTGSSPIPPSASSIFNGPTLSAAGLFNRPPGTLFGGRDMFELYIEVPHYKAEEVAVSTQDDMLIVSGKREEHHPEFGYQSKEFTNKYTLPKDVDKARMTCVFKERGHYLKIEAPIMRPDDPSAKTIPIKIQQSGDSISTSVGSSSSKQQQQNPVPRVTSPAPSTSKTASGSSIATNGSASVSHV